MILNIETSTEVCSISVTNNEKLIFGKEECKGPSHTTLLGGFVREALGYCQSHDIKLKAVSVSAGPGSYTGLRIGVSMAKGICFGMNLPLIAIETLELMSCIAQKKIFDNDYYVCPMIDARRMEVYSAIYDAQGINVKTTSADIITDESYQAFLNDNKPLYIGGNGASKCIQTLSNPNLRSIDNLYPTALEMGPLSERNFNLKKFVDVAYFEPYYLKEFIATIPKNKIIQPQ